MMGWRWLLLLVVIVLGLGAVLWFTDQRPQVQTASQAAVLGGRSLGDAARLRWQFAERPAIEIARTPDGLLQMQEPLVDLASAAHMKQIFDVWNSAQMRATPLQDDEAGRASAGLTPPELVFLVEFARDDVLTIEVGGEGPLGTSRFLRIHGRIWEGGEGLVESMRGNPDDFREANVFRNVAATASELRVDQLLSSGKRQTLHLKLERDGWQLLEPIRGRADAVAAQRFVTAVLSLRIDGFPRGVIREPEREPRLRILVRGGHGEEELTLWDQSLELFGKLPGRNVVFVSSSLQYADIFENAQEALRARILVPMAESAFAELVDIVIDPGQGRGDRVRLFRDAPTLDWALLEPVEYQTAPTPCHDAVLAIQLLVAMEFADDADAKRPRAEDPRYGLQGGSRLAVSVRSARDQRSLTLWLGKEVEREGQTFVYACRADDPDTIALVQRPQVETLKRSWLEYCKRLVYRQTAGVDRIEILRGGQKRVFQIEGTSWQLEGTPGARDEVGELVTNELVDLHGTKAVDARGERFATPDWTLRLMRRSGDELGVLAFWDGDGTEPLIVQRGGERSPVAFVLSSRQSRDLRALWQ